MKITLHKNSDNSFSLVYPSDYENAKKLKQGIDLECEIKKKRNYKFHKKFFALINLVFQNQERYSVLDDLREDLIVEAGFFTRRENLEGDVVKKAKSISFASMDELEFNQLYDAIINVIIQHFNFEKRAIEENIMEFY